MAFRLKADESPSKAIRRIVKGQIDKALGRLDGPGGPEPEVLVHDARRRLKKVRAMIRLVRGGPGRKLADREDARFRDAGRPLSGVRDACVLVEAFDDLIERVGPPENPEVANRIRSALRERSRSISRRTIEEEKCLEATSSVLRTARQDLDHWRIEGDGWGVLRKGTKRIYREGYRASLAAAHHPTDEALHEWRKRVKDLWYMFQFLQPVRPRFTDASEAQAHTLADALGDDHDLAVLRQLLVDSDGMIGDRADVGAIRPLIDGRRAELQAEAFALGKVVYRETPDDFVARLHAYWRAWRSEIEAARFD